MTTYSSIKKSVTPEERATTRCNRLFQSSLTASLVFGALFGFPELAGAQDAVPETPAGVESSERLPNPLNLEELLSDPAPTRAEFESVRSLRRRLASGSGSIQAFEETAEALARTGAYTTAIEVLWFAQKMQADKALAAGYGDQMRIWAQASMPAETVVEEGNQLLTAGRQPEAVDAFLRAVDLNPLSERAHFRLADAWRMIYRAEYEEDLNLAPLEIRARVFRDAYTHYRLAIEIDPLFYDAYYGLSELRGFFPENSEFLLRTQDLTQRALDYRGEVLPVLDTIESGDETSAVMSELGRAFEVIGVWDYAIFAYRVALGLGGAEPEVAERLNSLQARYF